MNNATDSEAEYVTPDQLKVGLYEQEHRLFAILWHRWDTHSLPKSSPLRRAAMRAFYWKICVALTPTIVAGGTTITAILAIIVACMQTDQMATQTEIIDRQGKQQLLMSISDGNSPPAVREFAIEQLPSLRDTNLARCNFANLNLASADFTGTNLRGADLNEGEFTKAIFVQANLRNANLQNAILTNANLSQADLSQAKLSGADLTGTDLTGTQLNGAILGRSTFPNLEAKPPITEEIAPAVLKGAILRDVNFTGANLKDVDLRGFDLSTVHGLTRDQISQANVDETTILPGSLESDAD